MEIVLPIVIVGLIGLIAGVGLSLASKFMAVPTDERQEKIREALPGANCGACGYSGCDGYAAALADGTASPDKCAPGGKAAADALAEILGVTIDSTPKVAYIACNGTPDISLSKYTYEGKTSCTAASMLHGGPLECKYGCVGMGDCASACPFGAIKLVDSRPVVCEEICVGCGKCVAACPKKLISVIPKGRKILVGCANKDKGAPVVKACSASCIACGLCAKQCENGAIEIKDNLPVIDYSICTSCGKCKDACKRKVII